MSTQRIKILYLAGWGRSGSTILSNVLGEVAGFFSVGEIGNLWQRGLLEDRLCGCGVPFSQCPHWQAVFQYGFGGVQHVNGWHLLQRAKQLSNPALLLKALPGGSHYLAEKVAPYATILGQLYQAIQTTTGCRVIIDASKSPAHGFILSTLPNVDLYVVHLVRDPRGVAYSQHKQKRYEPAVATSTEMERFGPIHSTLIWSAWNLAIERLWAGNPGYQRLRYEDFMQEPATVVQSIVALCQEKATSLPFVGAHEVLLRPNHNVSGNPSRFQSGQVRLQQDDAWKSGLVRRDQQLIRLLFYPLLRQYGYL
jgi:hypothetical protein